MNSIKPIQINSNSMLYRLAVFYGDAMLYKLDICEFRLRVLKGLFVVLVITLIGAFLAGFLVLVPLLYLFTSVQTGSWLWYHDSMLPAIILIIVAVSLTAMTAVQSFKDRAKTTVQPLKDKTKESSLVYKMYLSAKEKYCVPVEII